MARRVRMIAGGPLWLVPAMIVMPGPMFRQSSRRVREQVWHDP